MNLGELITATRLELLDDPLNVEHPDDNLWSDAELIRMANWAEQEACRRAGLLFDQDTEDVALHTLAAGDCSVTLKPCVLTVERVWFDGVAMAVTHEGQLRHCYGAQFEARTGPPQAYYFVNNTVVLYPKPENGGELRLRVNRLPVTAMAEDTDTPEIDEQYHYDLALGIAHKAFLKPDTETFNKSASVENEARFTMTFGQQKTAKAITHQRTNVTKRTRYRSV